MVLLEFRVKIKWTTKKGKLLSVYVKCFCILFHDWEITVSSNPQIYFFSKNRIEPFEKVNVFPTETFLKTHKIRRLIWWTCALLILRSVQSWGTIIRKRSAEEDAFKKEGKMWDTVCSKLILTKQATLGYRGTPNI